MCSSEVPRVQLYSDLLANPAFKCKDLGHAFHLDGALTMSSRSNIYVVILSLYSEEWKYPMLIQHKKDLCFAFAVSSHKSQDSVVGMFKAVLLSAKNKK